MNNKVTSSGRNYGIDLAKALSMLFVICGHLYMQGGILKAEDYGTFGYYGSTFVYALVWCAVDCFVIISGYVGAQSKFRLSRIIELWSIVLFWSVSISCVFMAIYPEKRTISEMVTMFFPILRGRYWFFNAYFVLFLFKPLLNRIVDILDRNTFLLTIITAICIFGFVPVLSLGNDVLKFGGGSNFSWFFPLYLVGGYLKKYGVPFEYKNVWNLLAFFGLGAANMVFKFITESLSGMILGEPRYGDLLLFNASPIVLGEAICLMLFLSRISIMENTVIGRCIKRIAPLVFSVYIIHVHPQIFWNSHFVGAFAKYAEWNAGLTFFAVIGTAIVIYAVCVILDAIRYKLFELLKVRKICERVGNAIESLIIRALCVGKEIDKSSEVFR